MKRIHHLGIACADIPETLEQIKELFTITSVSKIVHDPEQDADLCMVDVEGSPPFELIAGPVVKNIVRKGLTLYHTCWETDDFDGECVRMCAAGCIVVSDPKKAVLFGNRRVAFLNTPLGLVELLEKIAPQLRGTSISIQ